MPTQTFQILLTLLALFTLIGCSNTNVKYSQSMDTWINQKVDALLESEWGYPESKYEIPNGNMVYVYKTSETKVHHTMSPGISRSYVHSSHSYTVNYWCHTFFEVNKDNMIVKWKSDGNRCKAYAKENMAQKKL